MWPHKKACEESVGLERGGEEEKLIKMERNEKKHISEYREYKDIERTVVSCSGSKPSRERQRGR